MIRLILLFILFLTSQSEIAATTEFTVHQYDANHIVLSDEIYGYDTNINLRHCCQILLTANTQDWSFLAFVSDFVAPKRGYSPTDSPVRIQGKWSDQDIKGALRGRTPKGLGSPDLHHADQMPGSAIHEILPSAHRGNKALHANKYNQGVTPKMRQQDKQLHWWYRAREQGADQKFPNKIYD